MTDPVQQIVAWSVELLQQMVANFGDFRATIAVALGLLVLWWTVNRFRGEGADPQFSMEKQSQAGYTGVTLSGVHLVGAVVGVIGLLLWPVLVEYRVLQLALLGVVLVHYVVEKREVAEL